MTKDEKTALLERLYRVRNELMEDGDCPYDWECRHPGSQELEDLIFDMERDFLVVPKGCG